MASRPASFPVLPALPVKRREPSERVARAWSRHQRRKHRAAERKGRADLARKIAPGGVGKAIEDLMREIAATESRYSASQTQQAAKAYEIASILRAVPDEMAVFCRHHHWRRQPPNKRPSVKRPDRALHFLIELLYGGEGYGKGASKVYRLRKALERPFRDEMASDKLPAYLEAHGGTIAKVAQAERDRESGADDKAAPKKADGSPAGRDSTKNAARRTSFITTGLSDDTLAAFRGLVAYFVAVEAGAKKPRRRGAR